MIITKLEEHTKARYKVYLEQEFAFVLYKGEVRTYGLKLGQELKEEIYQQITKELLPKRAKLRAMNLLKSKEYTEKQVRDKLHQGFYPESCIEEAITYLKSYRYIDDARFARSYITYQSEMRSRRRIETELLKKGIAKDIIEQSYQEAIEEDHLPEENQLIRTLLKKKKFDSETASYEEKQKIAAFLYRKGFSSDAIRKNINSDF